MSTREIKELTCQITPERNIENPLKALDEQVQKGLYKYMLAFADDGVIWGYVDGNALKFSSQAFPSISPSLRPETLWEIRLFGEQTEWHLWHTDAGWQAQKVSDGSGDKMDAFTEKYILWGTDPASVRDCDGQPKDGFYPVQEADLGICHTPPLKLIRRHGLKLTMRHYLEYDTSGAVYIKLSRLVNLENGGKA